MLSTTGTIIFKPIEAKFNEDNNWISKMNPYCKIKLGWHTGKSLASHHGGVHPVWSDTISLPRHHNEKTAKIKLKDENTITPDSRLGEAKIDLEEVVAKGKVNQWVNIYKDNRIIGEIHLEVEYTNAL